MEIEFELTRSDYSEFLKLAYARMSRTGNGRTKFFVLNMVTWVFVGVSAAGVFRFYEMYDGIDFMHLNVALTFLALSVLWLFGATTYQRKFYIRYAIDEKGHLLKKQKASITDAGITVSTVDSKQVYAWSAIQGGDFSANLAYLFIDNGQALIFPKCAFKSDSEMEEYRLLVERKTGSK